MLTFECVPSISSNTSSDERIICCIIKRFAEKGMTWSNFKEWKFTKAGNKVSPLEPRARGKRREFFQPDLKFCSSGLWISEIKRREPSVDTVATWFQCLLPLWQMRVCPPPVPIIHKTVFIDFCFILSYSYTINSQICLAYFWSCDPGREVLEKAAAYRFGLCFFKSKESL